MCLVVGKNQKSQIATKPIIVYKVIYHCIQLIAPYQGDLYGYPQDLPIKLKDEYPFMNRDQIMVDGIEITSGGFHSIAHIENAKALAIVLNGNYSRGHEVYQCTIPVGAEYYEGYFNGWKAYCSKQLIIEKLCV